MKKYLLFLLVIIFNITSNAQTPDANGILYVDITKNYGLGNSWASPIKEFADALKFAKYNTSIKQIWVAKGTYYPKYNASDLTTSGDAEDYTFSMLQDVKIFGGFDPAKGRTNLNQRVDYQTTILSGNTLGTTRHVLVAVNIGSSILDGFKVTGGNADGSGSTKINGEDVYRRHGGAMNVDRATIDVRNCTFTNNHADVRGGAIYATGSMLGPIAHKLTLYNTILYNNTSGSNGSAISVNSDAVVNIRNCTISNNISNDSSYGGAVDKEGSGHQLINTTNTIIYNNYKGGTVNASNLVNFTGGDNSNFQEIRNIIYNGPLNYSNVTQAQLVNPNFVNEAQGNFRLKAGSPAIDKGANDALPFTISDTNDYGTDAYGFYRYINRTVDIGASEYSAITPDSRSVLYVKKGGSGDRTGSSWSNAIGELADAIKWTNQNHRKEDNSAPFDYAYNFYLYPLQIWVSKGTYKPMYTPEDNKNYISSPTDNRDKSFLMTDNVSLYGGFEGYETSIGQRNLSTNNIGTILSGDLANNDSLDPDITEGNTSTNISDNAYHVLVFAKFEKHPQLKKIENSLLDGFQIKGGNANGEGEIYINKNLAKRNFGGGIFSSSTEASNSNYFPISLTNMDINNNSSSENGGGIYASTDPESIILTNSRIRYNSAKNGGGFYTNRSSNKINKSIINHNYASNSGGGIYIFSGNDMIFANSSINNNSAVGGAAIFSRFTRISLKSSSIAGNKGASFINNSQSFTLYNSVVYGNYTNSTDGINSIITGGHSKDFQYSLVQGETSTNNGNIVGSTDPLFNNLSEGDLNLKSNSPIVNKGKNSLYEGNLFSDKDLADNPRLYSTTIDLGAYELQSESTLDLNEIENKKVLIYPNPVKDILNIIGSHDVQRIEIYNMLGQKVLDKKLEGPIDLRSINQGPYVLKIIYKDGKTTGTKILKN